MRRTLVILVVALVAVAVAAGAYAVLRPKPSSSSSSGGVTAPGGGGAGTPVAAASPQVSPSGASFGANARVPHLAHAAVIMMENHSSSAIMGSPSAPYINGLIRSSAYAADYSALTHPSLPNYIALTSGATQGITDDRTPPAAYAVNAVNLADRLDAAGLSWKAYAEGLPQPGYAQDTGLFVTKHEPFLYYRDVLDNAARRDRVVPFTQLASDLRSAATTPAFSFITPNLYNDMHDGPVSAGDRWLARTVPAILHSPAFTSSPSLLVITWDEGDASDNHVATIFAGNVVRPGARSQRAYDHYSLLHTIEAGLGLPPMTGNDRGAALMRDLFRR